MSEPIRPYSFINANKIHIVEGEYDLQTAYSIAKSLEHEAEQVALFCNLISLADRGAFTINYNYTPAEEDGLIHVGDDFRDIIDRETAEAVGEDGISNVVFEKYVRSRWNEVATPDQRLALIWDTTEEFMDVKTSDIEVAKAFRTFVFDNYIEPFLNMMRTIIKYDETDFTNTRAIEVSE